MLANLGHVWKVIDQAHQHMHKVRGAIEPDHHLQLLQISPEHGGVAIDEPLQLDLHQEKGCYG